MKQTIQTYILQLGYPSSNRDLFAHEVLALSFEVLRGYHSHAPKKRSSFCGHVKDVAVVKKSWYLDLPTQDIFNVISGDY